MYRVYRIINKVVVGDTGHVIENPDRNKDISIDSKSNHGLAFSLNF